MELNKYIDSLKGVYNVVYASKPALATSDKPTLLVGDTTYAGTAAAAASLTGEILLVVPLLAAEVGPRAACSGVLGLPSRSALVENGVAYLGSDVLAAAKYRLVENALCATQTAIAAETSALATAMGVPRQLSHQALSGAAGSSWSFREYAPWMMKIANTLPLAPTFADAKNALTEALDVAEREGCYYPLSSQAFQTFEQATRLADPAGSSAQCALLWDRSENPGDPKPTPLPTPSKSGKVGFIGLGAMGYGMVNVLRKNDFNVVGYDAWEPSLKRYEADGGAVAPTPAGCADGADVLVLMVVNVDQAKEVLFDKGAAKALGPNAVVILTITTSPTAAAALETQLTQLRRDVHVIDAPVSGGTPRAASGDLTILCAGLETAGPNASKALSVLQAMSGTQGKPENLVLIPGGAGKGAAVKTLNQILAGTHISSSAEAMAFAARLGLPLRDVRELLLTGPAQSWMMFHRGKSMLDGLLQPPTSMVSIFVKDMGIVVHEARACGVRVPLAALVHQQFVLGKAQGWGSDDDSSIVRLWAASGINVVTE